MNNKNKLTDNLKTVFEFTRKERRAIYWMISLIIIARMIPVFLTLTNPPSEEKNDEILRTYLAVIRESPQYKKSTGIQMMSIDTFPLTSLFMFDPNQLSPDSLLLLGISDRAVKNWQAYRSKGGRFKKPGDILKIYGMDSVVFNRLNPYITILPQPVKSVEDVIDRNPENSIYNQAPKLLININRADAVELKNLTGIGNILSERIVKYRKLLGGYYTIDQLAEVYGLSDETLTIIRNSVFTDGEVTSVNPSILSFRDLLRHPYIDYELAQILSNHKDMPPAELDSILITEISADEYSRLIHYLPESK